MMTSVLRSISYGRNTASTRSPQPRLSFSLNRLQVELA